ncbi:dopamine beta-hydroxylase [Brachionus plicatilis]|uniref:Dopamine beta-hydroxylase n=1 Tax=Brachionus plicatilis TaxID=10195 RepID=A0A3M7PUM9_BRAPC|nr:dopamine beta-hydroxylase [Brachionus plicatilis]
MLAKYFLALVLINFAAASSDFKYSTVLDHENNVRLKWKIEEKNSHSFAVFNLMAKIDQLPVMIGFGASDRGEVYNADLVVFELDRGFIKYFDSHTDDKGILKLDKKLDYDLLDFKISNFGDKIEILFERKLDTCDPYDYLIETGTVHLVHFILYNNKFYPNLSSLYLREFLPEKDSHSWDMKHTQLVKSSYFDEVVQKFDAQKTQHFEMRNNEVVLPEQDTTYWCKVFKLDEKFRHKHHIVAYESVISEASKGIVHHMELFHCFYDPREDMKNYDGPCKSEGKPAGLTQCRKVIAAWAMGAGRFVYPNEVGGVVGGEHFSPYVVLEIHYDNPKLRKDVIDSSGMRVFYIGGPGQKLREYDAGIMEVGLEYNPKNSIPPKALSFHHHGYCLSECTENSLPEQGITIFASQLHTHLTGRKVWTSLVRDNQVVQIINSDNHFDQMFQEIRLLQRPVRVYPGDALINTCVFETMDRDNMTFGGYSIRDEMCLNYIHYYPLSSLELCKSSIYDQVLEDFFEKINYYDLAETNKYKTIEENFNSIQWNQVNSRILSKMYDEAPISFSCNSSDGQHIANVYGRYNQKEFFEVPQITNLRSDRAPLDPVIASECHDMN